MLVPELMYTDSAIVSISQGETPQGETFEAEYTTKCKAEHKEEWYINDQGKQIVAKSTIYIPPTANNKRITEGTLIKVSTDNLQKEYRVTAIMPQTGFTFSHMQIGIE